MSQLSLNLHLKLGEYLNSNSFRALEWKQIGFCLNLSDTSIALTVVSEAATYKVNSSPSFGDGNVDNIERTFFNSKNALWQTRLHLIFFPLVFSNQKNGRHMFVLLDKNLPKAATKPLSFCTSFVVFGGFICIIT